MATARSGTSRTLTGAVLSRRWHLVQRLGEGGMGEVYAAEPTEGGPRVAVKVLHREFVTDPPVLARFLEEGRTCMRLVHPNIVRVHECAQAEDSSPYLVMELLEGVPLGAYTQNGGRVPVAQAVPILHGILAGLTAAHAQGIVHRDLKPDNVFLTRAADGTFVIKVLDFGIAKVMDIAGGMGSRTRTGMLLGTPAYMSPEQVKSARDVDQRADLWSAGVLFYEMLSGRVAFPAPTEYARLAAVMTAEPEPLAKIDPALAPLGPFIECALKKNRDERFRTAADMARALAQACPQIPANPDGRFSSAGPPPLSRLPEVPSLYAPQIRTSPKPPPSLAAPTMNVPGAAPAPPMVSPTLSEMSSTLPADRLVAAGAGPAIAPGGTLASQAGHPAVDPSIHVGLAQPSVDETLPSNDLPLLRNQIRIVRGVPPFIVVVLVVGALVAGLLLGWAAARMT